MYSARPTADSAKNNPSRLHIPNTALENPTDIALSRQRPAGSILHSELRKKLIALPGLVRAELAKAKTKNVLLRSLSNKLFDSLKTNTTAIRHHFKIIEPIENNSQNAADPNVFKCWDSIHLIENGAIRDDARSKNPDIKRFLHANHIIFKDGLQFIASQRPLKDEMPGFWKMLAKKKIPVIVDLTSEKDDRYNCDYCFDKKRSEGSVQFAFPSIGLKVKSGLEKIRNFFQSSASGTRDTSEQTFSISHNGVSHDVTRIHFKDWPDLGVISAENLITLANQVEKASEGSNAPVLIHCLAGVGRTGTLMSFLVARKLIAKESKRFNVTVNAEMIGRILLEVTADGRLGRGPSFVSTPEQFYVAAEALGLYFKDTQRALTEQQLARSSLGQRQSAAIRGNIQQGQKEIRKQVVDASAAATFSANATPLQPTSSRQPTPERNPSNHFAKLFAETVNRPNFVAQKNQRRGSNVGIDNKIIPAVALLWRALATSVTEPVTYVDGNTIEQEVTGLPCVSATAVSVVVNGSRNFVHANHVRIPQLSSVAQSQTDVHQYIAGQSPKHFNACETLLLKAIETRESIFQIVSPATQACLQRDPNAEIKKMTVAPILLQLLAKQAGGKEIIIGNQYRLTATKRENTQDHVATYDLKVTPLETGAKEFSIPITQIGLKFDMKAEEIRSANAALDQHLQYSTKSAQAAASEPIIISRKGVGRNATVIVYREILQWIQSGQITDDAGLDKALHNVIVAGRKARGLHFVHSAQQLQELRKTLQGDMAAHKTSPVEQVSVR